MQECGLGQNARVLMGGSVLVDAAELLVVVAAVLLLWMEASDAR
jgi:hypothetical protein